MKLLIKTTFYYIIISFLFFLIAGFIISVNTNSIIKDDIEKFLINREEIATTQIINNVPVSSLNNFEQKIEITYGSTLIDQLTFKDTTMYDIIEDEFHTYRKLHVTRNIGDQNYDITIFKSLIETNLFVVEILKAMSLVFIGLLLFLIIINLFISRNLWSPFKDTLLKLKQYELGTSKSIKFTDTTTAEFVELNTMLNSMISKIHNDYLNLKEFTENAAHELQTPLAIIRSKSEMLLQSKNLEEADLNYVKSIYNTTIRLSKINHGLSLLAKIESGAYDIIENINITEVVNSQLEQYGEMITLNKLKLNTDIEYQLYYKINPDLIEILISNLIRNTIKHNIPNGSIAIETSANKIRFSNSGREIKVNSKEFERFKRSSKNSLGLGLSIVKKICEAHQIQIKYSYDQGFHHFELIF